MHLLPGADQLLPLRGGNPHIGVRHAVVANESCTQSTGEGKNEDNGEGTSIRKPNVVFELIPIRRNVLVQVSA